MKNLEIEKLNSPVCEQAFKWLNEFKKIKANPLNIDREMILTEMKTKIISKDFDELEMEFDTTRCSLGTIKNNDYMNISICHWHAASSLK